MRRRVQPARKAKSPARRADAVGGFFSSDEETGASPPTLDATAAAAAAERYPSFTDVPSPTRVSLPSSAPPQQVGGGAGGSGGEGGDGDGEGRASRFALLIKLGRLRTSSATPTINLNIASRFTSTCLTSGRLWNLVLLCQHFLVLAHD
eukprot:gene6822-10758_t